VVSEGQKGDELPTIVDELSEPEFLVQALYNIGVVAVFIELDTGRICAATRMAELLFGYDRWALKGQQIEILVPDLKREVHLRHRAEYAGQPHDRTMGLGLELYARRSDGVEIPVDIELRSFVCKNTRYTSATIRRKEQPRDE
jgi:PAS domain S-box-containing protein